ncbi:lymphocyte cytosolic protein 2 isoform X1 [Ornithorhynchus anatinus]|uniref:lymphocyte cytosolic protein 2 isoform X1 n=1 Tax=Ornithorhynchus anatinus TaxID=9258 RepID=UPI0001554AA4|nr:lymphocyte cytosolic protein 2 isoform X1 [Ornithorhynchus anatinus]
MALRNIPFRTEVLGWDPEDLAEYFKKLNFKDCEKAVRKFHIDGERFLNLSDNDIQKFPKLRVPILSKLSQDINKNEERKSIFARKTPAQRFPDESDCRDEEDGGWSSFEDDYESPDGDQDGEDDGDYESPNEEGEAAPEDEADYEPPPTNDEEALQNAILPAKPFQNSVYIDRPASGKSPQQPPVPPQRPMAVPMPGYGGRSGTPPQPPPSNHEEPSRNRNLKPVKLPAPSIDRSTKPLLDRSISPFDRDSSGPGKKPVYPEKSLVPQMRSLGEHLSKIQKPPLPTGERHERSSPIPGKKPPLPKPGWGMDRRGDEEDEAHQRPLPQPALPPFNSNTFPSRTTKPAPKHSLPGTNSMPGSFAGSNLSASSSLPPNFSQGHINRSFSRGAADGRSLPPPNKQFPRPPSPEDNEDSMNEEWYVSYITRPEAEAALRKINQDGTFLVRDSTKKTVTHPYVLMVLYKNKVYNIQIRYQEQSQVYLLGTGLRGKEDFLSVADIIDYFRKTPLLLIDGKNRGSRYQCILTYAAGYA